jgi:hypothetical protein
MGYAADAQAGLEALMDAGRQAARMAVGEMFTAVAVQSPVDTGMFQSNWQTVIDANDLDPNGVGNRGLNQVRNEIWTRIERWDLKRPIMAYNDRVYGPRLEYEGWSSQAPNGFVRVNAARWPFFLKQAARRVGLESST